MSSRRIELLSLLFAVAFCHGCRGGAGAGADAGAPRSPETAACVESQRNWVLERVPAEYQQDVEATVRALLQDQDGLGSMPTCSGQ
jgi:hypothetical protein